MTTNGQDWDNNTNWLSDEPLGDWFGVTTGSNGRVTKLSFYDNQLTGEIPQELGNLSKLEGLLLHNNQLAGEIPPELGKLSNMNQLSLHHNQLTGEIPQELGHLSNPTSMYLNDNKLKGSIPSTLGSLTNLNHLDLGNNQLSGKIPEELGNLSDLWQLHLNDNQLIGQIPEQLLSLSGLHLLDLRNNQLTGEIPSIITQSPSIQTLYLGGNTLAGCVPRSMWDLPMNDVPELDLPFCEPLHETQAAEREALVALYQATNGPNWKNNTNWLSDKPLGEWYGVITDAIGRVTKLQLSENGLSGKLPIELGNLHNLEDIFVGGNLLRGCVPIWLSNVGSELPFTLVSPNHDIYYCPINEEHASLDNQALLALYQSTNGFNWANNTNWLSDKPLQDWFGVTTDSNGRITEIRLGENGLSGEIPPELATLNNLTTLYLGGNSLTGCAPDLLYDVPNGDVSTLDLHCPDKQSLIAIYKSTDGPNWVKRYNWLSDRPLGEWFGVTTDSYGRVTKVRLLSNNLTGEIPAQVGDFTNLTDLHLRGEPLIRQNSAGFGPSFQPNFFVAGLKSIDGRDSSRIGQPNKAGISVPWR